MTDRTHRKISKEEIKHSVIKAIDARRDEIIALGADIFRHPELGYKEHRTAGLVEEKFKELGLNYRSGIALTGVKATLAGNGARPKVCVMGELDAVVCPGHPNADPTTGAAHSCGHNAQVAAMVGVAMGLVDSGAMAHLDGAVDFFAVPAEEYVEIEFREKLRREGKIRFLGGKQELIALGELADVDLAMMCHLGASGEKRVTVNGSSNGFIGKLIRYIGREAHAGGAPHLGINALNAAMLGLMGIHANRETFRDEDHIRVHPIITRGGDLVNIIPADVRMETYVRGKTMDAIIDANMKVTRALEAGALAVGAMVDITDIPGYLPRLNDQTFSDLFKANVAPLVGGEQYVGDEGHGAGSTDMGDVSHLMPALHPHIGGTEGAGHSEDFRITDEELAYIVPAKAMALTVVDLLWDGAALAKQIVAGYKPVYTRESYLAMWDKLLTKKLPQ